MGRRGELGGTTYFVPKVGKFAPSEPVANDRTHWSDPRVSVDDAVRGDDPFKGVPRYDDGRVRDRI
jgi:hypothetical protein